MLFPVFPVGRGRFMARVCAHAQTWTRTGNTGNTGNTYIYLTVLLVLTLFPVSVVYRECTGNWGNLGQLIQRKSLSAQALPSFHVSPTPPPQMGQPNTQTHGTQLLALNCLAIRRHASHALFRCASNVKTSTCVVRQLLCCAVSRTQPDVMPMMNDTNTELTMVCMGPPAAPRPHAVGVAGSAIFLCVFAVGGAVHVPGVKAIGHNDLDWKCSDAA